MNQNCLNSETQNELHKKRKKTFKLLDETNISDYNIQESVGHKSRRNISLYKINNKHNKTKTDNVSDFKISDSDVVQNNSNNTIFDRLHKKKKHKYKLVDEMENSDECKIIESNAIEMNRIDLNNETQNIFPKKKKFKLDDEIKNIYDSNIQESVTDKSGINIFGVNKRIDKHNKTKTDSVSDYKISDSDVVEINENNSNNEIFHKLHKKRKHKYKLVDEIQNSDDCKIIESNAIKMNQIHINNETENVFYKKKKHKLPDKLENISDCNIQESVAHKSGINIIRANKRADKHNKTKADGDFDCKMSNSNVIGVDNNNSNNENFHKRKKKYKMFDEAENISDCKIIDSNAPGMNQTHSNSESLKEHHRKKKKKHNMPDEMENISDCNIQGSVVDKSGTNVIGVNKGINNHNKTEIDNVSNIEVNQNNCNVENFHKKKKKHKAFQEIKDSSNFKTIESNTTKVNRNDFNIEALNGFHKKKKHKIFDKMENVSDGNVQQSLMDNSETSTIFGVYGNIKEHERTEEDNISNCKIAGIIGLNNDDLSYESFKKNIKKKKKHKHALCDETENLSDCKITDSNIFRMNVNSEMLNELPKKKKDKLLDKTENISCYNIQELAINMKENNEIYDVLSVQKRINKGKQMDKCKTVGSIAFEINQNSLSSETFDETHKLKRKKHRHKNSEVEYMLETTVEFNNSNSSGNRKHMKGDKGKSIDQNPVKESYPKLSGKSKKRIRSESKMITEKLQENEKDFSSKSLEKEKNNQENDDIYTSFDAFTCNFDEVPVPFIVPLLHEDETVATIPQEKKAHLESNGVEIYTGKWIKTEDDILMRNFLQFGLKFGVNNPFQLLGINQLKKNDKLVQFLKAKHFLLRLGKDLNNRSLRSIYMRARKLFNPLKNKDRLSTQEVSDLMHAHQLVGNKWTRISDMLSRSDYNCINAYRWHESNINKGKWTPEEKTNLINAIKTVIGSEDISANNVKNISWKTVAKYVPTRNEFQCHKQWAEHHAWNCSETERKCWEQHHYGKLIYLIKDKYCFSSESEIDFKELHKHFNDVTPSYIFLRKKWLYLKSKVPKELKSNYRKYLDALKRMYKDQYQIFASEKAD